MSVVSGPDQQVVTPSYVGQSQGSGGGPPVTFYLLQEDGVSKIILEDGTGFLVLEH